MGGTNGNAEVLAASIAEHDALIGSAMREISFLRKEVEELHGEMRDGFSQLGVKLKKTRQKLSSLESEVEDTKSHDLRIMAGKYRWWKRTMIATVIGVATTVAASLILYYVFHVHP